MFSVGIGDIEAPFSELTNETASLLQYLWRTTGTVGGPIQDGGALSTLTI